MERIVERPGALDVHKDSVMACVRVWEGRQLEEHMAEFGTTVQGLLALRDWLEALGVGGIHSSTDREMNESTERLDSTACATATLTQSCSVHEFTRSPPP
jgi:hypothetical protein